MLCKTKKITLRDGRTAILRPPEKSDAAELIAYLTKACGETDFLRSYPEEWAGKTTADEEEFIENQRNSPDECTLVCQVDGRIAGDCGISRQRFIKTRHRGELGIAILKEYWNLGIGRALMEEQIENAREMGIIQLELEADDANSRGIALYEKLGFETVAILPDAVRLKDGTSFRALTMIKRL